MELGSEDRFGSMFEAFVAVVIKIFKIGLPISRNTFIINSKSMVLGTEICFVRSHFKYRLVMTSVPKFKFVGFSSGSKGNKLMAQANSKYGFVLINGNLEIFYGALTHGRITGAIGNKESVKVFI